jgi:hypothetical protein
VTHNKVVTADAAATALGDSPIKLVLRSKGVMWLSSKHTAALYWSHAGESMAPQNVNQSVHCQFQCGAKVDKGSEPRAHRNVSLPVQQRCTHG